MVALKGRSAFVPVRGVRRGRIYILYIYICIISFSCMWPGVGASVIGCIHMCIVHTFSEG